MSFDIHPGIYDALLDEALRDLLGRYPDLRSVFGKIDAEEKPVRYADYSIRRDLLHWESQSNTAQASATGQNLIDHQARGNPGSSRKLDFQLLLLYVGMKSKLKRQTA